MNGDLGVGIIGVGASPDGWARAAHVPAVSALPGLRLAAVSARSQASAAAGADAAARLGARPRAYSDPRELIADPEVDLVSIVSPVPTHRVWLEAAIAAGKPALVEWPVAVGAEATRVLARDAASAGVRVGVGLQARVSPAAREARRLLDGGTVGRLLSINVRSSTAAFGATIPAGAVSLEDPEVGMNLTTIQGAHTLDLATWIGGGLGSWTALASIVFPRVDVDGGDAPLTRVLADHLALQGRLAGGGVLVLEVAGGRPADATPFHMVISGDAGELVLSGGGPRGFQAGALALSRDGRPLDLPAAPAAGVGDEVANVAASYAALAADLADGGSRTADLGDAAELAERVGAITALDPVLATPPS